VTPASSPRVAAQISESGADTPPNIATRILRSWPDGAARATIVAVAGALFWLTWAHWGDIQVDCGREVYVPYQILRGKLLYRDLWYPYGPLEPYVSALLLKLFGEHLSVLYFLGLALAIGCALVLFEVGKMLAGRAVGLTVALVMLLEGFNFTIFNYIFPYTYSAPLGVLFSLLCLFLTLRHVLGPTGHNLMLAGLAAGLAVITKQEQGIACYLLLSFMVVMETVLKRSTRTLLNGIAACATGFISAAAVYGWFSWKVTPDVILYANWQYSPGGYYMRNYGSQMNAAIGLRFMPAELLSLMVNGAGALLAWFFIAKVSSRMRQLAFFILVAFLATILGVVHYHGGLFGRANNIAWYVLLFPRGLFFIGFGFFLYTVNELRKNSRDPHCLAEAALALFAVVSGIRVLAETAPFDYSIFYTMPLFLVFILSVTKCIGAAARELTIERRRAMVSSLLAAEVILLAAVLIPVGSGRTKKFQTGWGTIYLTPGDANTARKIFDFILEKKRHGRRVLLIPELPMMYAFTGTEAPSRWYSIVLTYLSPEQEEGYIADLNRETPDYVVECNWMPDRHGTAFGEDFGKDYDSKIYHWIEANYRVAGEFGHFQIGNSRSLVALLYQRRSEPVPVTH
jgi:hypothetical protein